MSVADLVERVLPAGPDAVFARAHPMLTELLGEGAFALGGGTALAAVWQHRHSTDVDLFADGSTYDERVRAAGGPDRVAARLRQALRPRRLDVQSGFLTASFTDGDLSLMTAPLPLRLAPPPVTDRVAGTLVALERPATILARKLHGRMIANGVLVLRDLYDIATAATLAPTELGAALESLSVEERRMIADELSGLPADWAAAPRKSGRPVIRPRLPPELARDPALAIAVVRTVLSSDNFSPRERRRAPTPRRGGP